MDIGLATTIATIVGLGGFAILPRQQQSRTLQDWLRGTYLEGLPGTGKTVLLMNWILEHRKAGRGVILVDVHDTCRTLLKILPADEQVVYVAPWSNSIVGLNLFQRFNYSADERFRIADSTVMLFKRLFKASWGDSIEGIIHCATLVTLEAHEAKKEPCSILQALQLITDESYRQKILNKIPQSIAKSQLESTDWKSASVNSAVRKLCRGLMHDSLMATLAQEEGINLLESMKEGQLVLCDFDQEKLGEGTSAFLAGLIMSRIQNAAMSRPTTANPVIVFADEFQTYCNDSFGIMIEQCRKRNVAIVMAHQSASAQLSSKLQSAVKEAGSHYYMRLTYDDARKAAQECGYKGRQFNAQELNKNINGFVEGCFGHTKPSNTERKPEKWEEYDFTSLPNFWAIVKELRCGNPQPVTKRRLPKPPEPVGAHKELIAKSNQVNGKPRAQVLKQIQSRLEVKDDGSGMDGRW